MMTKSSIAQEMQVDESSVIEVIQTLSDNRMDFAHVPIGDTDPSTLEIVGYATTQKEGEPPVVTVIYQQST